MLVDLRLKKIYDGFLFLSDARLSPPMIQPHRHLELELNLVVRGTITCVIGSRRFLFPERSLAWFFPDQTHQVVDRSPDSQYHVVVFKPKLVHKAQDRFRYPSFFRDSKKKNDVLLKILSPSSFQLLHELMMVLQMGGPDPKILNREVGYGISKEFHYEHTDSRRLNAGLYYLLHECFRIYETEKNTATLPVLHPSVQKALQLISYQPEIASLNQISKKCGLSPSHLCRLFKEQVGVPLSRYRNSCRIANFFEIYRKSPQKTFSEIVYESGFGSYPQFHKIFKESFHQTPRSYFK